MLHPEDFLDILSDTFTHLPQQAQSADAFSLLAGTAAVESGLTYMYQLKGGPGLGLFQMEPFTARWLVEEKLQRRRLGVRTYTPWGKTCQPATGVEPKQLDQDGDLVYHLAGNIRLQIFLARLRYWVIPQPIPFGLEEQAKYWKVYYNTMLGKGTEEDYIRAVKRVYKEMILINERMR